MIVEIVYRDRPHSVFEAQPPERAEECIATETRLSLEPDGLWIEADRYETGAAALATEALGEEDYENLA